MKPVRVSPWDCEFAVCTEYKQRSALAWRWYERAVFVSAGRWWTRSWARVVSVLGGLLLFTAIGIVLWRHFAPASYDGVLGGTILASIGNGIAWAALAIMGGSLIFQFVLLFRRAEPPGGAAVYFARHLRIAPFRAALRGKPDTGLATEHARRAAWWRARLARSPSALSDYLFASTDPAFGYMRACMAMGFACFFMMFVLPKLLGDAAPHIPFGPLMLVGMAVLYGSLGCGAVHHRLLRKRLRRSLASGSCPQCRYDLVGTPAAMSAPAEAAIGPARCPECGSPWPLVPPPAPD